MNINSVSKALHVNIFEDRPEIYVGSRGIGKHSFNRIWLRILSGRGNSLSSVERFFFSSLFESLVQL